MKTLMKGFIAAAIGIVIQLPVHEMLHAITATLLGFQIGGFFIGADLSWNIFFATPVLVEPATVYQLTLICLIPYIYGLCLAVTVAVTRKIWLTSLSLAALMANVMPTALTTDYSNAIMMIPEGGTFVAFLQLSSGGIFAAFLAIYLASFIRFKCSPKATIP